MKKSLTWVLLFCTMLGVMSLCVCVGSVNVPLTNTLGIIGREIAGKEQIAPAAQVSIILKVRLPRVLAVLLSGAALSLSGAAMQGIMRNPLADGSTLGVSSGAALGAAAAILLGIRIPGLPLGGTSVMAMLFAFLSLVIVLGLAFTMDRSLSTSSIILIGVVFSMFVSALMSLLVTFSGDKLRTITFWTMGSLASAGYSGVTLLLTVLIPCGAVLVLQGQALNLFALGEAQAQHLGVNVRRTKLIVMITVSILIGVCVSIGGSIAFVGLVVPHILRRIMGDDHRLLFPACLLGGPCFLMLCDLAARTLLSPIELPIGVVTSLVGAVTFIAVFIRSKKRGNGAC